VDIQAGVPQKRSETAGQIRTHIVGKSIEMLSGDIDRKYKRLPKRLGGLSVVPLTTYLAARLHRALSRDPKIRLESLVAPSRGCMQSEGETLDFLLATHFPNSVVIEREAAPAAACCIKRLDWHMDARVVIYGRVVWATDSFAPYKSPGMDGIFPAPLQEGKEVLIPYLVKIFCACLATGYVPAIWCQVKVVFPVGIPEAYLRASDLSVSHHS